jgi:hypothetical protein
MRNTYVQKLAVVISTAVVVVGLAVQPVHAQYFAGYVGTGVGKPEAAVVTP